MSHETPVVHEGTDRTDWYRNTNVTTRVQWLWEVLAYSSAYLALLAATAVALVASVLGLGALSPAVGVVWLVTFAVYATDRIADAETDADSMPGHSAFVERHGDLLYVLASLAYGTAVAVSLFGGPVAFGITLLPGAVWLLYATDWLPEVGLRRLKEVFVLNSAVVASAWAVTVVFLPLAFADAPVTPAVGVVFVYLFVRVFTNTEIPNVRDVAADRKIGVRTLPVVLGVRRTRHALYALDLSTAALVIVAAATGLFGPVATVALLAGVAYSLAVSSRVGRTTARRRLAKLADAEYVVSMGAFLALSAVL